MLWRISKNILSPLEKLVGCETRGIQDRLKASVVMIFLVQKIKMTVTTESYYNYQSFQEIKLLG